MNYGMLLVLRNPDARTQLRRGLELRGGFRADRICEAGSKQEAIQTIDGILKSGDSLGSVVTDITLGRKKDGALDSAGLELLTYVVENKLGIPVIVTALRDPEFYEKAMLQRGAFAYVLKDTPIEGFASKIREAISSRQK